MTLTPEDIDALWAARDARRTEAFLAAYRAKVEASRLYYERLDERQTPTHAAMTQPFNF